MRLQVPQVRFVSRLESTYYSILHRKDTLSYSVPPCHPSLEAPVWGPYSFALKVKYSYHNLLN